MNKEAAAKYLDVSVRALERYTAQERVAVRYVKGKTRPALDYDRAELERFKAELTAPVERPARPPEPTPTNAANNTLAVLGDNRAGALTGRDQSANQLAALLQALQSTLGAVPTSERMAPDATQAAAKLLLTLSEVQTLTGLSRSTLRAAIDAGELKARTIGRSWRIKRADLESYIKKL